MRRPRARAAAVAASLALALAAGCRHAPPEAALRRPDATLDRTGPDSFHVAVVTSRGPFELLVRRHWSPRGADRLYWLAAHHYYDGVRFFRVLPGFVAQFGLHGDSAVNAAWRERRIADDSVRVTNQRGTLSFATGGPDTRTTQLFINYRDNARLDRLGFAPVGQVVAGMAVVDSLYGGYGEGPPRGTGPDQGRITREGNRYLAAQFPRLDSIVSLRVTQRWGPPRR